LAADLSLVHDVNSGRDNKEQRRRKLLVQKPSSHWAEYCDKRDTAAKFGYHVSQL